MISPIADAENCVTFSPENCCEFREFTLEPCRDYLCYDAGELDLCSQGSIVELSVTLQKVCPNRDVALAVLIWEQDSCGELCSKGVKTLVVPGHCASCCKDIKVAGLRFVLPKQDPRACESRRLRVGFIAHYTGCGVQDAAASCCEQ